MARRQWKTVEKVILIGFITLAVMMTGLWVLDKEPNRAYYLPAGYEGWVTIRYSVEDAPALEEKDGVLQFQIGEDGTMETSDPLVVGWRRDEYFVRDGEQTRLLPSSVKKERGILSPHSSAMAIFQRTGLHFCWTFLLDQTPFWEMRPA